MTGRADDTQPAPRTRRNLVVLLLATVLVLQLGHVLYRGAVVGIDFYDAYSYLSNAQRLCGDEAANFQTHRPPLLPILEIPGLLLARLGGPANVGYRLAPHLTAALISIAAALAALGLYRQRFGLALGLVGAIAFAGQRLYVHYAPHALTDILATGCLIATVWLYVRARERYGLSGYVVAGLALGAAMLARHNLVILPALLGASEAALMLRERRFLDRCALGLALTWIVGSALALGVYVLVVKAVTGTASLATAAGWVETAFRSITDGWPGESRADYLEMAPSLLSWPIVVLAPIGLLVVLARPDRRDIPVLLWLLAIGGGLVAAVKHTEARYLLPIVPALIFLALRALEPIAAPVARWWQSGKLARRAAIGGGAIGLAGFALHPGLEQAVYDADPILTSDAQRRAAMAMLELHEPPGRFGWIGGTHNLMPRHAEPIPLDEMFSIYHFDHLALEYFSDRQIAITVRPLDPGRDIERVLAATGRPGDVYLRAHPRLLWTYELAAHRPPSSSVEIYSIRRSPTGGNEVTRREIP